MKGRLEKRGHQYLLRFERSYPHPCEDVWRALVEPERLADWFPAAIEGERRAGAPLRFVFSGDEGPTLEGAYRIFEPPRLLEFTWDTDVLRWELSPAPGGCSLVFTTTVSQRVSAPRDATGWEGCLDSLDAVLDGRRPPASSRDQFAARYREYMAAFGLGEFPAFMGAAAEGEPLLPNPALRGPIFEGPGGARLAALHALEDGETSEHLLPRDAYVFVIEGSYLLRLGGHELPLGAGTELVVPGGGRVSGRVSAGTRMLYAVSSARP